MISAWHCRTKDLSAAKPQSYNISSCSLDIVRFCWCLHKQGIFGVPACWWRNWDDLSSMWSSQGQSAPCWTKPIPHWHLTHCTPRPAEAQTRCSSELSCYLWASFYVWASQREPTSHSWGNAFPRLLAWSNEDIRWLVVLMAGVYVFLAGSLAEVLCGQRCRASLSWSFVLQPPTKAGSTHLPHTQLRPAPLGLS